MVRQICTLLMFVVLCIGCSEDENKDGLDMNVMDVLDDGDLAEVNDLQSDVGDVSDLGDAGDTSDEDSPADSDASDTGDTMDDADSCPDVPCDGTLVDSDDDNCLDLCCECPPDFEFSGTFIVDNGQCVPSCADATCGPDQPCSLYVCNLSRGTCAEPEGFCSNAAACGASCETIDFDEHPVNEVCGCDGQTWRSECEMYCNGVAIDHAGPCE